jgi:hypothetical protein
MPSTTQFQDARTSNSTPAAASIPHSPLPAFIAMKSRRRVRFTRRRKEWLIDRLRCIDARSVSALLSIHKMRLSGTNFRPIRTTLNYQYLLQQEDEKSFLACSAVGTKRVIGHPLAFQHCRCKSIDGPANCGICKPFLLSQFEDRYVECMFCIAFRDR